MEMVTEAAVNSVAHSLGIVATNEGVILVAEVVGEKTVDTVSQIASLAEACRELVLLPSFYITYMYFSVAFYLLSTTTRNRRNGTEHAGGRW